MFSSRTLVAYTVMPDAAMPTNIAIANDANRSEARRSTTAIAVVALEWNRTLAS
jgi:hypothetical protein